MSSLILIMKLPQRIQEHISIYNRVIWCKITGLIMKRKKDKIYRKIASQVQYIYYTDNTEIV